LRGFKERMDFRHAFEFTAREAACHPRHLGYEKAGISNLATIIRPQH
jgi:hypothetical protein